MEKRKLEQKKIILPKDYKCKLCTGIGTNFGNNEFKCYGLVEDIRINTLHTITSHEKKKQSIILGVSIFGILPTKPKLLFFQGVSGRSVEIPFPIAYYRRVTTRLANYATYENISQFGKKMSQKSKQNLSLIYKNFSNRSYYVLSKVSSIFVKIGKKITQLAVKDKN